MVLKNSENQASSANKSRDNADVKPSSEASGKIKFGLMATPEVMDIINDSYQKDGSACRSMFIENAVRFYNDYLTTRSTTNFLAPVITRIVDSSVQLSEQRISRNLFKIAVELGKISHMIAATSDIDDETVDSLHRMCVDEVRRINGVINYESAVRFQKDE